MEKNQFIRHHFLLTVVFCVNFCGK